MSERTFFVQRNLNAMSRLSRMTKDQNVTKSQLATAAIEYLEDYFYLEAAYKASQQEISDKGDSTSIDPEYVAEVEKERDDALRLLADIKNNKIFHPFSPCPSSPRTVTSCPRSTVRVGWRWAYVESPDNFIYFQDQFQNFRCDKKEYPSLP